MDLSIPFREGITVEHTLASMETAMWLAEKGKHDFFLRDCSGLIFSRQSSSTQIAPAGQAHLTWHTAPPVGGRCFRATVWAPALLPVIIKVDRDAPCRPGTRFLRALLGVFFFFFFWGDVRSYSVESHYSCHLSSCWLPTDGGLPEVWP